MYRLLLVAILSCIAISGFARRQIVLEDRARFPISPIVAFIDEDNKELLFDFGKDQRNIRIIITDLSGNTIYSNEMVMGGFFVLPLPKIDKGEYFLCLLGETMKLHGSFDIK